MRLHGQVIGVVRQALHLQVDGLEAVLEAMAQPEVAIVSLTISEKGYCYQPASGQLLSEHPDIQLIRINNHYAVIIPE